jgi:hypothetical protein
LTLDSIGNLYLADYCNAAVFEFVTIDGSIPALPTVTKVANSLGGIEGVAVSAEGTIYAGVVANSIPAWWHSLKSSSHLPAWGRW